MDENSIVSHLPALLRYARGLTLSDSEGEVVVEATLQGLLRGNRQLDTAKPLHVALLEQVHRNWIPLDGMLADPTGRKDGAGPEGGGGRDGGLFAPLSRAAPGDRAAFLLVRFEGLSEAEAASVMNIPEDDLRRRLARAERRVFRMARPRLLIVESKGRSGLIDWDDVVAEADCERAGPIGFEDAVAAAGSEKPDVVVAALAIDVPASELVVAERVCFPRNTPLILLAEAPDRLPDLPWIDLDCVVAAPFGPASVAAAVQRALYRARPAEAPGGDPSSGE